MKKLTVRQFQHNFGKTTTNLKPGQSLTITKQGKPIGVFTKLPARRIKRPDFLGNLEATGVSEKARQPDSEGVLWLLILMPDFCSTCSCRPTAVRLRTAYCVLSFDPRSRAIAKAAGLRLQPERL